MIRFYLQIHRIHLVIISIGKILILSLFFPPIHTVRATFTAHGVPSIIIIDLWPLLHTSLQSISMLRSLLFSICSSTYYSSLDYIFKLYQILFLVPFILSIHYYLGHCYNVVHTNTPLMYYGFSHTTYYLTTWTLYISVYQTVFISQFCQFNRTY